MKLRTPLAALAATALVGLGLAFSSALPAHASGPCDAPLVAGVVLNGTLTRGARRRCGMSGFRLAGRRRP